MRGVFLSLSGILAACGNAPVADSPEQAAAGYRDAMSGRDFERALAYLTPKAQKAAVGGMYISAAYASQANSEHATAFAKLVKKHRLDKNRELKESANLPRVFADVVDWMDRNLPDEADGNIADKMVDQLGSTTYSDFEVDGDRATATMVTGKNKNRVSFEKIDGHWFMGM